MNQFFDYNCKDKKVCIMGLGYVGLTLATVMAEVGFRVFGVEIQNKVLDLLESGVPHFYEPGLADRLKKVVKDKKISFSKFIPDDCDATVFIITVGTPLDSNKKVRMDMIESVSREVSKKLKDGDLVILRSTVKLGTARKLVLPILQESGVNFDLAFCPERTLEGQALSELRQLPQIVGALTMSGSVRAAQIFQFLTPTVVRVSDLETAEIIKLIDNSQRDSMFAFSNEVAKICNVIGVSAVEVIRSGKLGYARTNLMMPGPVGGPCLEKDPYILAEGLKDYGVQPEIILAGRKINEEQPQEVVSFLKNICHKFPGFPENPVITLLGIAFKGRPVTDDLRGTMARPIFETLKDHFKTAEFRGYDAVVKEGVIAEFGLKPYKDLSEAIKGANLVVILNNHPVFADMPIESLAENLAKPSLIYDFWNNFTASDLNLPTGVGYMSLGSHGKAILP